MNLVETKVLVLTIFLVLKLFFGILPLFVTRWWNTYISRDQTLYNVLLGSLNCFAGGVFLGVAFLHLIPETAAQMESVLNQANIQTHYPLTELGVIIGLFLVLILENMVMVLMGNHHKNLIHLFHGHSHAAGTSDAATETSVGASQSSIRGDKASLLRNPRDGIKSERKTNVPDGVDINGLEEIRKGDTSKIRVILLYLSLSTHAIFEGLALGLQDAVMDVWTLFGAMMVHEVIIAFTLSMKLVETFSVKSFLIFVLCFSTITPIGVGIGIPISADRRDTLTSGLTTSILECLATGTFLYVTFFEILNKELQTGTPVQRLRKTFFIVLGCVLMGVLAIFEQKSH